VQNVDHREAMGFSPLSQTEVYQLSLIGLGSAAAGDIEVTASPAPARPAAFAKTVRFMTGFSLRRGRGTSGLSH
jgi:hypothetical protein